MGAAMPKPSAAAYCWFGAFKYSTLFEFGEKMKFKLSNHTLEEIERRGIPREMLERVLDSPQQVVLELEGKKAYQSQIDFGGGRMCLLRAIVNGA